MLSQLDALVQSITLTPAEDDYDLTTVRPRNGEALVDMEILEAPRAGSAVIGHLAAGNAIPDANSPINFNVIEN